MSTTNNDSPQTENGIHELLRKRWSPREFSDRAIAPETLRGLFEAAHWSASCFNEQPWRFVFATKANPEKFEKLLSFLMEKNQQWAKNAYAIGFTAAKKTFTVNGAANRFGLYDTGAAGASLAVQATAVGLHVHYMGGFDAQRARTECGVPEDFDLGAAFVVGYVEGAGDPPAGRTRKSLDEIVFGGDWGTAAEF